MLSIEKSDKKTPESIQKPELKKYPVKLHTLFIEPDT